MLFRNLVPSLAESLCKMQEDSIHVDILLGAGGVEHEPQGRGQLLCLLPRIKIS